MNTVILFTRIASQLANVLVVLVMNGLLIGFKGAPN